LVARASSTSPKSICAIGQDGEVKPGARRHRSLLVLLVLTLVVFGGSAAAAFFARPERVVALTAQSAVAPDGSAHVTETIDYRFSGVAKHGIYRDVPGLAADTPGILATDDGHPAQVLVTANQTALPDAHIRIGDPNHTVSGDHAYVVSYPLPTVIDVKGAVDWNGVGTGWGVDIDRAVVDISGPWTWVDATCTRGAEGSTTPCKVEQPEPGLLAVEVDHLDPHQGVTVRAGKGQPLTAAPPMPRPDPARWPSPGPSPLLVGAVAAAAFLLAGLPLRAILERLGRDEVVGAGATDVAFADGRSGDVHRVSARELAGMASIEFAPPKELAAWQGGIVSTEEVRDAHKVAWLLEAAIAGHLELDQQDETITLTRTSPPAGSSPVAGAPVAPDGETVTLLDMGFAGRPSVTLGKYDQSFAAMWRALDPHLRSWMTGSDLWEQRGRTRQRIARFGGGLLALAGLAGVVGAAIGVAREGAGFLPLVALAGLAAGLGVAAVTAGFELMVRTPKGSGLWVRVESFRRFLHGSEGPQAEEAARRGVLRQYTAWAIALDEVHHWSKAVEAAGTEIRGVDQSGLGYVYMAPLLITSTHTASVAPHSTGGGGGVGGGFGGGGGGSW
jgi:hypothetical protein